MPRPRKKENLGLPARWRRIRDTYYYDVPPGLEHLWDGKKLFRLGKQLNEASRTWADRMGSVDGDDEVRTIGDLLDRYAREVIPGKAAASQANNRNQLPSLRRVFGLMPIADLKPQMIYKYIDARSKKVVDAETGAQKGGRVIAYREIELLSHAYTKAIEWGYIDRHPFKGEIRLTGIPPRRRYVEDWEVAEILRLRPRRERGSVAMIQAYIRLKLLTGLSQGDLLRLRPAANQTDEGIRVQRHKTKGTTGKTTLYLWTDDLKQAWTAALQARSALTSDFLFCNRDGEGYINEDVGRASGWKSMWQHFMGRVLKETKVTQPFTEHDLRAKVASDAPTLDQARALLSHSDSRTTERIYRRGVERVIPSTEVKVR